MRVVILMLLCMLAACSSSDNAAPSSGTEVGSDEFQRDPQGRAVPNLAQVEWTHDYQSVTLNTEVVGEISEGMRAYVSFRVTEDQVVAVTLDGEVRDLDLRVWDELDGVDYAHSGLTSDEGFVVYAKAHVAYFVEVIAARGNGPFSLKVMEPHRSAFDLQAEELYVVAEGEGSEHCLTNGGNRRVWDIEGWQYQYIYNVQTRAIRIHTMELPYSLTDRATLEEYSWDEPGLSGSGAVTLYAVAPESYSAQPDGGSEEDQSEAEQSPALVPHDWFFYGTDRWDTSEELDGPLFRNCIGQVNFESVLVF